MLLLGIRNDLDRTILPNRLFSLTVRGELMAIRRFGISEITRWPALRKHGRGEIDRLIHVRKRRRNLIVEALEDRRLLAAIQVTTHLDVVDANDGFVSLREAIAATNVSVDDNEITFAPAINGKPIVLSSGQLVISDTLTIQGNPAINTLINANELSRAFFVNTTGDVALNNLTITGGLTSELPTAGGGIFSQSASSTLTITGSQIISNRTTSLDSGGGGISVNGNLILIGSTVANNSTSGANSPGGGIASPLAGNIRIENSTISGNSVLGTSAFGGGGIYFDDGDVTIQNSTITGNTAPIGGGIGIFADSAGESLSIGNSIIAGNSANTNPDFTAPGTPAINLLVSYSLIGNNEGTTLTAAATANADGNLIGAPGAVINPRLLPLQLNGGTTLTHMLFIGSPAMDSGQTGFARNPDEDQRGGPFRRVANGRLDMGAVELQITDPSLLVVTTTIDELDYSNTDVSLREAINTAGGALFDSTISFAENVSGTIELTLGQLEISKGVTINGPGQSLLTIDANQRSRVVNVVGGTDFNVTLRGLTITGGQVTDDDFASAGTSFGGGGVSFGSSGTLQLDAVTVSSNVVQGLNTQGAGIFSNSGSVLLTGSTVSGNRALGIGDIAVGGGLATVSGSVTLVDSTVTGNSTEEAGGNGGGIYSYYGDITLTGSTVSANRVEATIVFNGNFNAHGGGVSARRGNITLTNSTVSGNSVTNPDAGGGGVAAFTGGITLINSTLTGNRAIGAASQGGGVDSSFASLTIHNSIIAGNSATSNPDFTAPTTPATDLEVRSSLIGNNQGTSLAASSTADANGNLIGAPGALINPRLGPLNLNFGTTQTHALLTGSPAFNAGSNALIPTGLTTDQRGESFVRQNGIVDIGAFELQSLDPSFFIVTTTNDEFDYSNNDVSLREAINSAGGSLGIENISFADGVTGEISLTLGELTIFDSMSISGPGQSLLSINANQQSRVLNVTADTAIDVTLSGLTITGGQTTGDNVSFEDPRFSGAGIFFVSTGSLRLDQVTVSNNATQGTSTVGGGIFSPVGTVLVSGSTISGNSVNGTNAVGGGIVTLTSPVVLLNSTVTGNRAVNRAGGIYSFTGPISLTDSTVSGNRVDAPVAGSGGGIYSRTGPISLTRSTVSGNRVTSPTASGGGISTVSGEVSLVNSTVSGNQTTGANSYGAGLHVSGARVFVLNSTITGNVAGTSGGGITIGSSNPSSQNLSILNSIVAGNTAGSNPDFTASSLPAANLSVVHSLIGNNTGTTLTASANADANGNRIGTTATPINPNLAPLALSGGKTQTHALLPGSPAINAGRNSAAVTFVNNVVTPISNDQRGVPFVRIANGTVDMGAFEVQTFAASSFIVTTTGDEINFTNTDVSLREAIITANGQAGPNTITFAEAVFGAITLTLGELPITESLTITGPGQSVLKIDADGQSRVFNVSGDSGPAAIDLAITGLTITGGQTIGNNSFTPGDNLFNGGGIRFNSTGNLTLTSSTVSGNRTSGFLAGGGAIYTSSGTISLVGSTIANNSTAGFFAPGGGILTSTGAVTLTDSTISGNFTTGDNSSGGGLFTVTGDLSIFNSTVSGNQVTGLDSDGGGLLVNNSLVRIVNSTLTRNEASRAGGGLMTVASADNKTLTIHNSIIAGNIAPTSADFTAPTSPATKLDVRNSLIGDNAGTSLAPTTTINGNLIGTTAAQINPVLGPLNLNGGATQTHALLTGSPALNAGNNALAVDAGNTALALDQRRFARIDNTTVDIGAYEFQRVTEAFFFIVTTTEDEVDGDFPFSLREVINFANGNPGPDTITFDGEALGELSFLLDNVGNLKLSLGELPITESLTIVGPGQTVLSIDADQRSRVFHVFGDSLIDLAISGVSINGGQTTADSDGGGGIRFSSTGTLTLTDSTVSGNTTSGNFSRGGGIYSSAGAVNLVRSTIAVNGTSGLSSTGGGVSTISGAVRLTASTITGNTTSGDRASGGGISTYNGDISLINSTLSSNRVTGTDSDGGGLHFDDSLVTIVSSTIANNEANRTGGGLNLFADSSDQKLTIHNSIIAANTATTNADFTAPTSPGTNLEVRSSLIGDNTGTSLTATTTTDGNLIGTSATKIDPRLGPLALNGGTMPTHALLTGSPAINAGSNARIPTGIVTDQRGAPFTRTSGVVDIGAFEAQTLPASSFIVTTASDELDYSNTAVSLREAINSANGNVGADTITFDPAVFGISQTISLRLGELQIGESITINGPGQSQLAINANRRSRVINVIGGTAINVTLSGLTITGGQTESDQQSGGGISFDSSGTLTLNSSTVTGNRTTGDAANGGGIYASSGAVILNNSTVSGNSTSGFTATGGGIHANTGAVSLSNSSVVNNSTTGNEANGGGLFALTGAVTLLGSTVAQNRTTSVDSNAGGIFALTGLVSLVNSTISGNMTANNGGGIIAAYGQVSLINSTVTNNSAAGTNAIGGGILAFDFSTNPAIVIRNSIVAGNTVSSSGTGADLRVGSQRPITLQFSIIGDNTGTTLPPAPTVNANGNLIGTATAKIDPLLAPLAANGGTVLTHALLSGSPAINGGLNTLAVNGSTALSTDQRGAPFTRIANSTVDIGAFESQTLAASSFIVTTTNDELDFSNTAVSLREAINSANGNLGVDTITFASGVTGTITLTRGELPITQSMTITGPGANLLAIDANEQSRVLNVFSSTAIDVSLTGLTIRGGRTSGSEVFFADEFNGTFSGAGIRFDSSGTLTLSGVMLSDNSTAGLGGIGGGLFANGGTVTVNSSTVSANSAAGAITSGGGIAVASGVLNLNNSTVSGNSTSGAQANGGGIFSSFSTVTLVNSTITGNRTPGDGARGGGLYITNSANLSDTTLTMRNSIVAGNTVGTLGDGPDLFPSLSATLVIQSSLIGDNTGTTLAASATPDANGNLIGTVAARINPLLGPLQNNGGPMQTHALLTGSPAIDAGSNPLVPVGIVNDQRGPGFPRINSGTVDIGSFESLGNVLTLDFGDAPSPYPVTLANNGARHATGALFLGASVDAETDGSNSAAADSDGSDEDGVFVITSFITTTVNTISSFSVISSGTGRLDGWIDFNNDGDWLDAGEQIFTSVNVLAGQNLLSFTIPANSTASNTGARFRLSTAGSLAPTGAAADGEVEDYLAAIIIGASNAVLNIDAPAGDNSVVVEGNNLVVRRGPTVLFQAPFNTFGTLNLNGSSLDDILTLTILEALASRTLVFDGGLGRDFLNLLEAGRTLDLTNASVTVRDIEGIDIRGTGDNTLVINVDAVKNASTTSDLLEVVSNLGDTITFGSGWTAQTPRFINGVFTHLITETAVGGTAAVQVRNDRFFQNPLDRFDVDRSGTISAVDALRIINQIGRKGLGLIAPPTNDGEINTNYFDVTGDNMLSALDALVVINSLARIRLRGESAASSALTAPIPIDSAHNLAEIETSDADVLIPAITTWTAKAAFFDLPTSSEDQVLAVDTFMTDYGQSVDSDVFGMLGTDRVQNDLGSISPVISASALARIN